MCRKGFLFRLNKSRHRDSFVLKGGILFYVWSGLKYRPTKDLDFLFYGNLEEESLLKKIDEVWDISIPEDGINYNRESLQCQEIKEEHEYGGLRISFYCSIDNNKVKMQLDICTGDKITPHIREQYFPSLLSDESPLLKTYPIETVLAEKTHAIINLDIANSRLKDFFDVYTLITSFTEKLDIRIVKKALMTTFSHRELTLPATPIGIFTEYFFDNPQKQSQWKGFLKRSKIDTFLELEKVCNTIAKYLNPLFQSMREVLAKTAISMEFGRDLETIKVDGYENEEILLSYIRQDDGKPFKYKVKFDKENIRMIWAGREIDEFGDGRWRDKPEDSIISYSVVDDGVEVKQLHSDGSKAKRIIENFF